MIGKTSLLAFVTAIVMPAASAEAATLQTIFNFGAGATPFAPVVVDNTGIVYGTTAFGGPSGAGSVYKLTPPASGRTNWTLNRLHDFTKGADGGVPFAGVTLDGQGGLYGLTTQGGVYGQGVAFHLTPPAAGSTVWTETVIWNIPLGDYTAGSNLIVGKDGNLYGTTEGGGANNLGTVFSLVKSTTSATGYTFTILHSFTSSFQDGNAPSSGVVQDPSGALYGTTLSGGNYGCPDGAGGFTTCGTVFTLFHPASAPTTWFEIPEYLFNGTSDGQEPSGPLSVDSLGDIYGSTLQGGAGECYMGYGGNMQQKIGCGVAFLLTPLTVGSGSTYIDTNLWSFTGSGADGLLPTGQLVAGQGGKIYGLSSAGGPGGVAFTLAPPAPGQTAWTENLLAAFNGTSTGNYPYGGLTGYFGALYGTTDSGGSNGGGTIFRITLP